MKKAITAVRLASAIMALASTTIVIIGQFRRHGTHADHSKRCACLSVCNWCAYDAAIAKEKEATVHNA